MSQGARQSKHDTQVYMLPFVTVVVVVTMKTGVGKRVVDRGRERCPKVCDDVDDVWRSWLGPSLISHQCRAPLRVALRSAG